MLLPFSGNISKISKDDKGESIKSSKLKVR